MAHPPPFCVGILQFPSFGVNNAEMAHELIYLPPLLQVLIGIHPIVWQN